MKSTAEIIESLLSLDERWLYVHTKIMNRIMITAGEKEFYNNQEQAVKRTLRTLLEAFGEETINLIPKYGDEYEIEVFRAEQRLKVKEIINSLKK